VAEMAPFVIIHQSIRVYFRHMIHRLHNTQNYLLKYRREILKTSTHVYRVGQKVSLSSLHITSSNSGQFWQFFHCPFSWKCAIKWSLNIPPHLKHVATLTSMFYELWQSCWKKWTLHPDAWQAALWALNDMLIVLPSAPTGNVKNIRYISILWNEIM